MRTTKAIANLRQEIHDGLRRQNPEWVLPNGECPMCDVYEARLMNLLALLPDSYLRRATEWQQIGNQTTPLLPFGFTMHQNEGEE